MAIPQHAELFWAHIDSMVADIFSRMARCRCSPVLAAGDGESDLVARVAFGIRPQNVCEVALSDAAARVLVLELTGIAEDGLREDMAGELCNMIAGGWKSLFTLPVEHDRLLPPSFGKLENGAIVEGRPGWELSRRYGFGSGEFTLHLRWCADECFALDMVPAVVESLQAVYPAVRAGLYSALRKPPRPLASRMHEREA